MKGKLNESAKPPCDCKAVFVFGLSTLQPGSSGPDAGAVAVAADAGPVSACESNAVYFCSCRRQPSGAFWRSSIGRSRKYLLRSAENESSRRLRALDRGHYLRKRPA